MIPGGRGSRPAGSALRSSSSRIVKDHIANWQRSLDRNEQYDPSRIADHSPVTLPRVLGPVEAFCVVVGSVIGSGIFLVPGEGRPRMCRS